MQGVLAVLLIALLISGCSTWQVTKVPASALTPAHKLPNRIRLELRDGKVLYLDEPRVDGDSLRGVLVPQPVEHKPAFGSKAYIAGRPTRAVALGDIATIESNRFSAPVTLVTVIGGAGLIFALFVVSASNHEW